MYLKIRVFLTNKKPPETMSASCDVVVILYLYARESEKIFDASPPGLEPGFDP